MHKAWSAANEASKLQDRLQNFPSFNQSAIARCAGLDLFSSSFPGVCSLRSLHPKLYAVVRSAD